VLRGAVQLCDALGVPMVIAQTPDHPLLVHAEDKAVYIRRLLQNMECVLRVEIDDVPSLGNNPSMDPIENIGRKRERLVLFECGAGTNLIQASQHLVLDHGLMGNNTQQFNHGWHPVALDTGGFHQIACASPIYRFEGNELWDPTGGEYS
jgi:hypothetical protein